MWKTGLRYVELGLMVIVGLWMMFAFGSALREVVAWFRSPRRRLLNSVPNVSVGDLLRWSQKTSEAMTQVKTMYDWRISQWSTFSTALMTATLAFLSAALIGFLKGEIKLSNHSHVTIIFCGASSSLALYAFCHRSIASLRREFTEIYRILGMLE